ncbi:hypothetical protein ACFQ4C_07160 [Larkinella insperata]|uniref:Uncharacterized protein n=1 Tax=Larkinella insperata TaxID=332158 RepID=A0ABW3QGU0_9BACT
MKLKLEYPYDGLIWEVSLTKDLGYAYVQTIDPRPIGTSFPSYLLKILDYRSEISIQKFDVDFFENCDMLTSHLLFRGRPPRRNNEMLWKPLCYLPITSFDRQLPESKLPESYFIEPETVKWSVFWGGSLADYYEETAAYDQVKHLGHLTHFNVAFIHHRITMEWMRKLGLDYNQYYTKDWDDEFLLGQKYQVKSTVLFSGGDPVIRGKAFGNYHKRF